MAFHPLIVLALLLTTLQRLTVTQLTLAADPASPKLELPFNLVITGHVREKIASFENVDLPILSTEVELLGDSRSVVADSGGTTYRETIHVVAHHTGKITIPPVTLDAVDARDGKPKRYSSNALTIEVQGGALRPQGSGFQFVVPWFLRPSALFVEVSLLAAILVLWLLFKPGRAIVAAPVAASAPQVLPRPVQTRASRLRDALTTLRVERTRPVVMRIRHIAREMVGADDAETLADVVARPQADESMRTLLRALERAAFTYDADLQSAIEGVIAQLERMT